jgi:hypothetical protein
MNPRRRNWAATMLTSAMVLTSSAVGTRAAVAAFADNTVGATSVFAAAPDWVAPLVGETAIAKKVGYLAGFIKQGGTYYVYADVTDTGNPASGVAETGETANVTALTATGAAVTLVPGSYSVGGTAYTHRSGELVAATGLTAGSKQYSVSSRDVAGNSRIQTGYAVTVDNTVPTASNIQTTNGSGGTAGRAQPGDTIVFTYSEQIDPESTLPGWTGASINVVVRLIDGGCTLVLCSDDIVTIWNASDNAQLPLGSVNLSRSDYHGGSLLGAATPLRFGASGTPSTMVQSGATITVTLGTGSGTADTAGGTATMAWAPSTIAYDAAGNLTSSNGVNEGGTADREF